MHRPISLLRTIGKLFKMRLLKRLIVVDHTRLQFNSRENHSTKEKKIKISQID